MGGRRAEDWRVERNFNGHYKKEHKKQKKAERTNKQNKVELQIEAERVA